MGSVDKFSAQKPFNKGAMMKTRTSNTLRVTFYSFVTFLSVSSWCFAEPVPAEDKEFEQFKTAFKEKYQAYFPFKECKPVEYPGVMTVVLCKDGSFRAVQFAQGYAIPLEKTKNYILRVLSEYKDNKSISPSEREMMMAVALQDERSGYLQDTLGDLILYMTTNIDPQDGKVRYNKEALDEFVTHENSDFSKFAGPNVGGRNFLEAMTNLIGRENFDLMLGLDQARKQR